MKNGKDAALPPQSLKQRRRTRPKTLTDSAISAALSCPRLDEDIESWGKWRNLDPVTPDRTFVISYTKYPEFRTLVKYRFRRAGLDINILPDLPGANDLYIVCDDIGGGFRIQHGHSTWVLADRIGRNFHVNQNVTIGLARGSSLKPRIGDNVSIHTGAVVAGNISIGNRVVIAPNAFVNFDVPENKKVFPARSVII